ncbi:hypothetical protein FHX03_002059 [Rhizobium sp. BK456]|nr:hypothetical protein [Rhizobium sp. BK456]
MSFTMVPTCTLTAPTGRGRCKHLRNRVDGHAGKNAILPFREMRYRKKRRQHQDDDYSERRREGDRRCNVVRAGANHWCCGNDRRIPANGIAAGDKSCQLVVKAKHPADPITCHQREKHCSHDDHDHGGAGRGDGRYADGCAE